MQNPATLPSSPQVVDMELPPGARVLGAALLQEPCAPAGGAAGGGAARLLVLTDAEVVSFRLA
jgi:hypothetical protein